MARIRTVKPEFWEDETIGTLSRDARLLFIATFNMADDEGLLRWTVAYIKAQAFVYDEDLSAACVGELMNELTTTGLVYPYRGGKAQQQLGMIVNFHRHQRVNRPQPSKLAPPSLQLHVTRAMYARRDGYVCHLCGYPTNEAPALEVGPTRGKGDLDFSPDHVIPRSAGGTDYPGNIRNSHISCNKGRGDRSIESFTMPRAVASALGLSESMRLSVSHSVNEDVSHSVNGSLSDSLLEGKGREGKGKRTPVATAPDPLFGEFWAAYPRKTDKGNARKAWDKALKKTTAETLIAAAAALAASCPDLKFTPHPTTWLNGERWADESPAKEAARRYWTPEAPPKEIADDPAAYAAWYADQAKRQGAAS